MRRDINISIFLTGIWFCLAFCLACCLTMTSYGQSLGEVAREQRLKKQSQSTPTVITNEDLPARTDDADEPDAKSHHSEPPSRPLGSKSAAQWKAEIAKQRSKVTSLQNQIEKVNASIRFAPGTCVRNCVEHNEHQIDKQDQVQRMKDQLEEAKKTLDDLQEGARREGFGNAVWEP